MRNARFNIFYVFLALMGIILIRDLLVNFQQVSLIPYSQFQELMKEGKVEEVFVTDSYIKGRLSASLENGSNQFVTARVENTLANDLSQYGVKYSRVVENTFLKDLISWLLPAFIFLGIWLFIMRRLAKNGGFGGQLMSIGKSRAKVYVEEDTKVRFEDVAGVDEAKEDLIEVVNFLKDQEHFSKLGARIPKGVLLVGPPGTGKTLLAKAVAGEAQVPFFSISGSEFVEMFVGVGAARVRDLFEQARKKSPCIIFIDELDALGRSRIAGMGGGHDEKEQTLNQLLVELDGFDSKSGIVLLAATNRPEILDSALLRSGRFDRQILVDKPDRQGRLQILKVHTKKIKMAANVELEKIAAITPGFTGADIANLANEAALVATRRNADSVDMNDFSRAIERIVAGLEKKNRILSAKEREMVAYHEMGHALVAASLPGADPVHKVSIIPRGMGALGYTMQRPKDDRYLMTRQELENRMAVLLGGRAAEKIIFDHLSTGAADDINKATSLAREMVTRFGMDEDLGHVAYDDEVSGFLPSGQLQQGGKKYSEESAKKIDFAVKGLTSKAFERALSLLQANLVLLHESARALISSETLSEEELLVYFKRLKPIEIL